jgi:predicted site-specific integrase-resolvase
MTIKRTKTGHAAARAKRRRPIATKVARARSSDAGDITSKPMLIGYARVSTVDQNLALQSDALAEAGCAKIFTEQMSGAVTDRPALPGISHRSVQRIWAAHGSQPRRIKGKCFICKAS